MDWESAVLSSVVTAVVIFLVVIGFTAFHMITVDLPAYSAACTARGGTIVPVNRSVWDECWNTSAGTRIFIDGH